MATDPAHLANTLVDKAFGPFFGDRMPRNLGREAYCLIRRWLRPGGLGEDLHAEEAFARALASGFTFLKEKGGEAVGSPRPWFLTIAKHASFQYMRELNPAPLMSLEDLLEGREPASERALSDDYVFHQVREAIRGLPPRYQELIRLDLYERLSPSEIQQRMNIRSVNYFRKLKCEAFRALREALRVLVDQGIDNLL